jgi:HSP20 family protein
VKSADLDLNVTANQLTLAGERKISDETEEARYHRREREAGRFSRAIGLPGDIDADNVKARLADGVLTVTISKAEKAKPRQIAVQ